MRLTILMIVAVMMANGANAATTKTTRISCLVDKSNAIVAEIRYGDLGVDQVTLSRQNFMESEGAVFLTLAKPSVTEYGSVIMITKNNGRSGYAFLRFDRQADGSLQGWIDIDLFLNQPPRNRTERHRDLTCTEEFSMTKAVDLDIEKVLNSDPDCATLKSCGCYELCKDVCRIVNGEKVCQDSCKTICM